MMRTATRTLYALASLQSTGLLCAPLFAALLIISLALAPTAQAQTPLMQVENSGGSIEFEVNSDFSFFPDLLGVGTNSPATPLHVAGSQGSFRAHPIFGPANGTVLLGAWVGDVFEPQVRYATESSGTFYDIGMDAFGDFVVERNDAPGLKLRSNGDFVASGQLAATRAFFDEGFFSAGGDGTNVPGNTALTIRGLGVLDAPDLTFETSANDQWRIDQFGADPVLRFNISVPGGINSRVIFRADGDVSIDGTLSENSDRALKTNIQPLGPALEKLLSIPAVRYQFKAGTGRSTDPQVGLIAQDVQAVFPELVSRGEDGHLSLAYSKFAAVLLQGLQEQQAQIDHLQAQNQRVNALEARLATMEQAASGTQAGFPSTSPLAAGLAGLALVTGIVLWRRRAVTA